MAEVPNLIFFFENDVVISRYMYQEGKLWSKFLDLVIVPYWTGNTIMAGD